MTDDVAVGPHPLLQEVRGFLDGLRLEWPELFAPRPPAKLRPANGGGLDIPREVRTESRPWPGRPGRGLAKSVLAERAGHWSRVMGVEFRAISVKDQRTLWGSCSRRGNLNFNWRLVLAPPAVLDYVVVHELAHLMEMNHSRRFWSAVERHCPDYREHRRWLRKNGGTLRVRAPALSLPQPGGGDSGAG